MFTKHNLRCFMISVRLSAADRRPVCFHTTVEFASNALVKNCDWKRSLAAERKLGQASGGLRTVDGFRYGGSIFSLGFEYMFRRDGLLFSR